MRPKHFLNFENFSRQDLSNIIDRAIEIKSKSETSNLFDKKNLPSDGLIDGNIARETLEEHLQGKRNWDYRLWPILMWQQWNSEKGLI